jgi:hypothetical protein
MAILDIEFEWPVATAGYVLQEREGENVFLATKTAPGPSFIVTEIVPVGRATNRKVPLATNRELYLQFAELEDNPAAFVEFATAWGLLTAWGLPGNTERGERGTTGGELVGTWSDAVARLKSAVAVAQRDPDKLVDFAGRAEPALVARLVRTGRARPSLRVTPRSLLHGLWLQLYEAVSLNTEIKNCDRCGRWFERGAETDRGRKARFCSDTCRFGFHNERRSAREPA